MSNAQTAIRSARIYLNDVNGVHWSDMVLMPLLQEAFGELLQELDTNGVGVIKAQSPPITIPPLATNMGNQQPANIITPISMLEGNVGDVPDNYQDMLRVTWLPYVNQTDWLTYWAWIGETIQFVGCTVTKSVILRYEASLPVPQVLTDPLGMIFAERFLGPRIAALAFASIQRDESKVMAIAERNLYSLVRSIVVQDQRPTRRKGYRAFKPQLGIGPAGITISTAVPQAGAGVLWIPTSTPPDGVRTTFIFPYFPKYISWNGINQFSNVGYTLSVINGQYSVTFKDILNNVLTPGVGDDIREEVQ